MDKNKALCVDWSYSQRKVGVYSEFFAKDESSKLKDFSKQQACDETQI